MLEDLFHYPTSVSLLGVIMGLLVLHFFYSSFSFLEKGTEPPGPKPLPLLGNLLQVDLKKLDSSLFDLSKKYGPVLRVYFGLKKVIVLAGYRTVKQALVNHAEDFGDREVTPIFYDFNKGHGILFSNGNTWKEMRRFALTTLRDFGMGKKITEGKIIEECHYLIEEFEQHDGKAFNNTQTINYAASNIISAIMFGRRFEYKDPVFQAMVERDHESIRLTGSASILVSEIKDSHYNDENLVYSVMNLFAAGTETTGNTLQWCLVFMAKYPHIQDQVQEELSRVVGSRQGTTVFLLLTSVLYDENEWESPHTFNPSHFLDKEGKFIRRDAFMPFSAGRRVCLVESLARMELFLFFTSLLQRFRFIPPPGVSEDELDLTPVVGFTLSPSPHELCAVCRQ
ncbi:cytochrome P450 2K1-like [Thunnus albacares]|uniref:cytochrome P450 2K1-like n=1 Tax=Thunnus albacares TaxID=8236 RepID=UPI001CF717E2|nr:cytochrome P450 2K1-like [Thunnus albacares]